MEMFSYLRWRHAIAFQGIRRAFMTATAKLIIALITSNAQSQHEDRIARGTQLNYDSESKLISGHKRQKNLNGERAALRIQSWVLFWLMGNQRASMAGNWLSMNIMVYTQIYHTSLKKAN